MVDKRCWKIRSSLLFGNEHPASSGKLWASETIWIGGGGAPARRSLSCKIRYRQADQPCTVESGENGLTVTFDHPRGQSHQGNGGVYRARYSVAA